MATDPTSMRQRSWQIRLSLPCLLTTALLGAAALPPSLQDDPSPAPARVPLKHVLLVTVDTFRPDYMSMNGYPLPTTPALDALLAEGTYFERAITPIPRTTQAFASLFTGAYPHTTGVRTLTSRLQPSVQTLGEVLQARGYQTLAVVTNRILDPERGLDRGFDVYRFSANVPYADTVTGVALAELEKADPERPTFLWVHYLDPHIPYDPPGDLARDFDPGYEGLHEDAFYLRAPDLPESERANRIYSGSYPDRVNEHIRRLYAAMIRSFDDGVAPLISAARERFGDELLIVFTADHGESLGEHDYYWDHGDYVYDASTRVPLGFVFPASHALHGGRRRADPASLIDVAPTLLDLLELSPPEAFAGQLEGRSLVPALRGEATPERALFAECGHCYYPEFMGGRVRNQVPGRYRAVMLGDWKLIWTPFQTPEKAWELYDLAADPGETRNLFSEDSPEVKRLREHLDAWMKGTYLDAEPVLEGADLEALKALGYVR